MARQADVAELKLPSTFWHSRFWRSASEDREVALPSSDPLRCDTPVLRHAEIAAVYSGKRVAGDFYEFLRVGPSRMLFVPLDIAGLRVDTREILIAVQKTFRTLAPKLFAGEDFNETISMIELCHEMNLTILHGGVRSCLRSLVATTKTLGRFAFPMRAILQHCFATGPESRRWKRPGCR